MQTWEYLYIILRLRGMPGVIKVTYFSNSKYENLKNEDFHEVLGILGGKGWELVHGYIPISKELGNMVFKRPLEDLRM